MHRIQTHIYTSARGEVDNGIGHGYEEPNSYP